MHRIVHLRLHTDNTWRENNVIILVTMDEMATWLDEQFKVGWALIAVTQPDAVEMTLFFRAIQ